MTIGLAVYGGSISSYLLNSGCDSSVGTSNTICGTVLLLDISRFKLTDDSYMYVILSLASLLNVCEFCCRDNWLRLRLNSFVLFRCLSQIIFLSIALACILW